VIARYLDAFGVPNGVRISAGSDDDNLYLGQALEKAALMTTREPALCV
jgi:hypothetical protein